MSLDNIELDNLAAGDDVATDLIATDHYQYIKMTYGASGTATVVTSKTVNPFPVEFNTLPAGSATIGEVTIGTATTAATDLAKAIDVAVGANDVGVAVLAKHKEDLLHLSTADGDWDTLTLDSLGQLHVNAEGHHVFNDFNTHTDFTALDDATTTIASSTNHVLGDSAVSFNKVDGSGGTSGCIDDTITSVDLGDVSPHDLIQTSVYLPALTNILYVFIRLGDTDKTNYNEWRIPVADLTAATWETLAFTVGDPTFAGSTGNGWNPSAIDYIAVGVEFSAEGNALSGIVFDQLSYHTNLHTNAIIGAEVTTSINSSNVNIHKIGNTLTTTDAGAVTAGTQRITLGSDDPAVALLASIDSDTNIIQGAVAGGQMQVDIVADGAGLALAANQLADGHNVTIDNASIVVTATDLDVQSGGADMATAAAQLADGHGVAATLTAETSKVIGTVRMASGGVASGSYASGAFAAGAITDLPLPSGAATATLQDAHATGGMSYTMLGIAAADNDVVIKGSPATVYFISIQSIDATPVYLKLFDLASFTPGSDTADMQFMAPSQGNALGSGVTLNFGPHGIQFANGLCALVATGFALADNTAVSANEVIVTIGWE